MSVNASQPATAHSLSPKQKYLVGYNGVCLALWGVITLRAALLIPTLLAHGKLHGLLEALQPLVTVTQSLAVLEVVHSLVRIVRAATLTTAMQVASRLLVVWGILGLFPEIVSTTRFGRPVAGERGGPIAFTGIITAWGVTECIRYGFFVWTVGTGRVPSWLTWLRYNTFLALYPLGISSECWLIYLALKPAQESMPMYHIFLKMVLLIYIPGKPSTAGLSASPAYRLLTFGPGSYILYTHMMSQRRRTMKGKSKTL